MTDTDLKLRDYQEHAVQYLHSRRKAGLFLDMGLGKTAICLRALTPDRLPALVTAPRRVAQEVWPEEAGIWAPHLTVESLVGRGPAERAHALAHSTADIIVISRDVLADAVPYADRFSTFIIDELSGFKNRGTARWKAARKICRRTPNVWGLTGTPSPNGLLDLWAQVYLLDEGARLGTGITAYRQRYFSEGRRLPSGIVTEWNLRPGADRRIYEKIEDLCLSMGTEGRVALPPVTSNRIRVALPPSVKKVYRQMRDTLVADLRDSGLGLEGLHTAANAAVLTSKLSQISAGLLYEDDAALLGGQYRRLHTAKIDALREVLDGNGGSPVLVFYRYRAEAEMYREAFPEAETMDSPGVVQRWNRGEVPLLLAHPASAGHGLNLQHGGHTVVWTTPTWSLEEYQQANKRLARSGQRHPVVIHHLVAEGTVDSAILTRLEEKSSTQKALLDHLMSPL